jgi:hypothetical protein
VNLFLEESIKYLLVLLDELAGLNLNLTIDQLVNIYDNLGRLDVQQNEAGDCVTGVEQPVSSVRVSQARMQLLSVRLKRGVSTSGGSGVDVVLSIVLISGELVCVTRNQDISVQTSELVGESLLITPRGNLSNHKDRQSKHDELKRARSGADSQSNEPGGHE